MWTEYLVQVLDEPDHRGAIFLGVNKDRIEAERTAHEINRSLHGYKAVVLERTVNMREASPRTP